MTGNHFPDSGCPFSFARTKSWTAIGGMAVSKARRTSKSRTSQKSRSRRRNLIARRSTSQVSPTSPTKDWLNPHEAGEHIGFSDEHIKLLARKGLLQGHKIRGIGSGAREVWRFQRTALDRWIESGGARNGG
jgi:hypothetical protein